MVCKKPFKGLRYTFERQVTETARFHDAKPFPHRQTHPRADSRACHTPDIAVHFFEAENSIRMAGDNLIDD
jgi:hypothetical protein